MVYVRREDGRTHSDEEVSKAFLQKVTLFVGSASYQFREVKLQFRTGQMTMADAHVTQDGTLTTVYYTLKTLFLLA